MRLDHEAPQLRTMRWGSPNMRVVRTMLPCMGSPNYLGKCMENAHIDRSTKAPRHIPESQALARVVKRWWGARSWELGGDCLARNYGFRV